MTASIATSQFAASGSGTEFGDGDPSAPVQGLDGVAVAGLLQGAVLKGFDPRAILAQAAIDPAVYGDPQAAIDGRALFRLVRQAKEETDDIYLGFLAQKCRLTLEAERVRSYLHCATMGEALRTSLRFTEAIIADIEVGVTEEQSSNGSGLRHISDYRTINGVERDILVWLRFVEIYHVYSWFIGRPLALLGISLRGEKPVHVNGFDRFALFRCPIEYEAPIDSLIYDRCDLTAPLVHHSYAEYEEYIASDQNYFSPPGVEVSWHHRTEHVLADLAREGLWSVPMELVAPRLKTRSRRLRRDLAREGTSFQEIKTRLRGELAGAYLLATDLPISTIGWEVGFSAPDSFTRGFLGWAGITPSDYRVRYRGDKVRIAAATELLARHRKP